MNTIDGRTLAGVREALERAAASFTALVVGTEGELFSAGANLHVLLEAAKAGRWAEIDAMIRTFQDTNAAIKASPVPVVAAPAGLALGGGCEICLHTAHIQAAAETYLGLVETGVGLIPAAGGCKEMLLRAQGSRALQDAFETMALAKVSTSAEHARQLGYLRASDGITMNRQRLMADARSTARSIAADYRPPALRLDVPVGGADTYALLALGVHLAQRGGRASDHDARVARKLAWVLSGGSLPHRAVVSETYLLDLEREAFLSLCGEPLTIARIEHTLTTGKALRN
jgi:3-hydroxyacyl-CoA dehydrogenase